jgi:hypothetical protein
MELYIYQGVAREPSRACLSSSWNGRAEPGQPPSCTESACFQPYTPPTVVVDLEEGHRAVEIRL